MKGKENVLSEVNVMMTVYNLRRLMSIFDLNDLKTRLKALVLELFGKIGVFKAVLSAVFQKSNKYRYAKYDNFYLLNGFILTNKLYF